MLTLQPNHKPVVHDALKWLKNNGVDSHASTEPKDPHSTKRFVPSAALRNHFDYNRLTSILADLRPDLTRLNCQRIAGSIIREGYAVVFCILLRINKAQHVQNFLRHNTLSDHYLPFPGQRLDSFPDGVSYEAFREKQWPFCPYQLFANMDKDIPSDLIIAIQARELLEQGDSTFVYRIKLHPDYDGLDPDAAGADDTNAHTYVLKTYHGSEAQKHYDAEVEAFAKIQDGGKAIESLLRYYGTYRYEDEYHVILEYADEGTLEDYFRKVQPPRDGVNIIAIWSGAFDLAQALHRIHTQNGWHQDINPANILVRSKPGVSAYSYSLKVGDYGRSHFKEAEKEAEDTNTPAQDWDTFGTKIYGAPECYRPDHYTQITRLPVPQSVDIWSLGCVWSEVAVWIIKGYAGLEQYRTDRRAATESEGVSNSGCFHDGTAVLGCVTETHNQLRFGLSDEDYLTGNVWTGLISKMLDERSSARPASLELCRETFKRLDDAKKQFKESAERGHRLNCIEDLPEYRDLHLDRAQTVPDVTKAGSRLNQRTHTTHASLDHGTGRLRGYVTDSPRNMSVDDCAGPAYALPRHSTNLSAYSSALTGKKQVVFDDSEEDTFPPQRSETANDGLGHARDAENEASRPISSPWFRPKRPASGSSQADVLPERVRRTVPDSHSNMPRGISGQSAENSRRSLTKDTIMDKSHHRIDSHVRAASGSSYVHYPPQSPPDKSKNGARRIPDLKFLTAMNYMREKQTGKRNPYLPHGAELKGKLRKRDHLFLVDDSTSMYACRSELCPLFRLLAFLVEEDDPDGVELLYANSRQRMRNENSAELADHVDNARWNGHTNLENRLTDILEEYGAKISARRNRPTDVALPLSIYVLTDGVWEGGGNPEVPMMDLVQTLKELDLPREQIGIQFIGFGENAEGLERMRLLDEMSKGFGLGLDIVDTERSDGNLWKMLLGAIDEVFDNDTP